MNTPGLPDEKAHIEKPFLSWAGVGMFVRGCTTRLQWQDYFDVLQMP